MQECDPISLERVVREYFSHARVPTSARMLHRFLETEIREVGDPRYSLKMVGDILNLMYMTGDVDCLFKHGNMRFYLSKERTQPGDGTCIFSGIVYHDAMKQCSFFVSFLPIDDLVHVIEITEPHVHELDSDIKSRIAVAKDLRIFAQSPSSPIVLLSDYHHVQIHSMEEDGHSSIEMEKRHLAKLISGFHSIFLLHQDSIASKLKKEDQVVRAPVVIIVADSSEKYDDIVIHISCAQMDRGDDNVRDVQDALNAHVDFLIQRLEEEGGPFFGMMAGFPRTGKKHVHDTSNSRVGKQLDRQQVRNVLRYVMQQPPFSCHDQELMRDTLHEHLTILKDYYTTVALVSTTLVEGLKISESNWFIMTSLLLPLIWPALKISDGPGIDPVRLGGFIKSILAHQDNPPDTNQKTSINKEGLRRFQSKINQIITTSILTRSGDE